MNESKNTKPTTADRIKAKCDQVAALLIEKNKSYGDSALHPVGIFGQGKASDLIRVRIDDKLSRIQNSPEAFGEDPVMDLLGYLVLLSLAIENEAAGDDRRGTSYRDPRPDPGHLAGVGEAEAACRREKCLTNQASRG